MALDIEEQEVLKENGATYSHSHTHTRGNSWSRDTPNESRRRRSYSCTNVFGKAGGEEITTKKVVQQLASAPVDARCRMFISIRLFFSFFFFSSSPKL